MVLETVYNGIETITEQGSLKKGRSLNTMFQRNIVITEHSYIFICMSVIERMGMLVFPTTTIKSHQAERVTINTKAHFQAKLTSL